MQVADASRMPASYNDHIPAFSPLVSTTPALPNISAGVNIAFHSQKFPSRRSELTLFLVSCVVHFFLSFSYGSWISDPWPTSLIPAHSTPSFLPLYFTTPLLLLRLSQHLVLCLSIPTYSGQVDQAHHNYSDIHEQAFLRFLQRLGKT
jgi:hypothetical protein